MYQFVWTNRGDTRTEETLPMLWHGQRMRRMGWSNPIKLVFLEGLESLSRWYRGQLNSLGYEILDCSAVARRLVNDVHPLLAKLPATERNWLLRWTVLGDLAASSKENTVVVIDSDVVFMSDPVAVERDLNGKTVVLQGNPHFVAISDGCWYRIWQEEVNRFLACRREYMAMALRQKATVQRSDREYCNAREYVAHRRFHEQDLLQHLIASGRLPQARTEDVFRSPFYWIQNPLMPAQWFEEQRVGAERSIVEDGEYSFVGNKQLAYYHFLTVFVGYCVEWFARRDRGAGQPDVREYLKKVQRRSRARDILTRVAKTIGLRHMIGRRAVYDRCFTRNRQTGNLLVTDITNSCW